MGVLFFLWDRFKLALQQNEIMDVFYIDWLHLGDADGNFGNKSDNHLKVMPPCLESMLSFPILLTFCSVEVSRTWIIILLLFHA